MKLIIVRHGQTDANKKGLLQGHLDVELNGTGRIQARKVGLKLKDEEIDVIFSSDLKRTRQTAKEIVRFHKVPIYYTNKIRERNGGIFEGKDYVLMKRVAEKSRFPLDEYKPKGGESLVEVKKRIRAFLKRLYSKYKGKTVVLVTHGGVTRAIMSLYSDIPLKKLVEIPTRNTGILVIDIKASKGKRISDEMFVWKGRMF